MTKRFLAFTGENYYPCGGWNDFCGSFDSLDEAKTATRPTGALNDYREWAHIVDLELGEEICQWLYVARKWSDE